jgi:hypothetical protein
MNIAKQLVSADRKETLIANQILRFAHDDNHSGVAILREPATEKSLISNQISFLQAEVDPNK